MDSGSIGALESLARDLGLNREFLEIKRAAERLRLVAKGNGYITGFQGEINAFIPFEQAGLVEGIRQAGGTSYLFKLTDKGRQLYWDIYLRTEAKH
ncbi:MAG: hypothetical protein BV456_12675 [Thermoplasmata archaeon M8B2D]|nr:MAG: hypothetical protein BV456_12675 [Thermoplasmata archaeon M8B2D]